MEYLTADAVAPMLDDTFSHKKDLAFTFKFMEKEGGIQIARKDENLVSIVKAMKAKEFFPLVDLRLKLVIGITESGHAMMRMELFRYFHNRIRTDMPYIDPNESQDRYISDGYGYFISSMRPDVIIVGTRYKLDRFDDALFAKYTVETFATADAVRARRRI